jgi:hypothetical protein
MVRSQERIDLGAQIRVAAARMVEIGSAFG